jgi:hypothetical protein
VTARRHRRATLAGVCTLGTLLLGGAMAQALPPTEGAQPAPAGPPERTTAAEPPVAITVGGTCPNAEAIWAAIASIVPAKDLDRFASSAKVEVSDLGDTYRVSVHAKGQGQGQAEGVDQLRVYRDLAHDCDHRARFAAVFIVLTLMPPDVLLDVLPPQPPPSPPPPPPPPPPLAPPRPTLVPPPPIARRRVRLELSLLGDFAPRSAWPPAVALGGELRVAPGPKRLGPVGAVGVAGGSIDFGSVRASELRVPFDLGLRFPLLSRAAIDLVADLGFAGAVFRDRGKSTPDPQAGTRLDLGARAGVVTHLGRLGDRLLGTAGLHVEAFPRPYDVTLTPQGTVGHTPALWVGATLGLAVQP